MASIIAETDINPAFFACSASRGAAAWTGELFASVNVAILLILTLQNDLVLGIRYQSSYNVGQTA